MDTLRSLSRKLGPFGLTALRVVVGIIMAVHGWLKLADYDGWVWLLGDFGVPFPSYFAPLSVAAELGGGLCLLFGFLTPLAAAAVLANLLTAIFLVHAQNGLLARDGGFEYPLTLAATAFFFMLRGAGPVSLDHALFGGRREEREEPEEKHGRTRSPWGREAHV